MAAPYVYTPLAEPRHIRLLQVWLDDQERRSLEHAISQARAVGTQLGLDDGRSPYAIDEREREEFERHNQAPIRIRGRLVTANLDNLHNSYKAVSYCWGLPDKSQKIWLEDGSYLDITASAMEILAWIALSGTDGYFWIDALCINQMDNDEKSSQVRLMYDVYSRAEEVVAWTGYPSEDSHHMMELLPLLQREFYRMHNDEIPVSRATIANIEGCEYPSKRWDALAAFLQRPIFRRVWIVQEMVAAKFIKLMCGVYPLDWTQFAMIIVTISGTGLQRFLQLPDQPKHEAARLGAEGLSDTFLLRCQHQLRPGPPPFSFILAVCERFQSTDPRDRIFALLNISSETKNDALMPDYNKSVEEVFETTARHLLTRANPLIALLGSAGIGHERKLVRLSSWIPDWTTGHPSTSFCTGNIGGDGDTGPYNACGKDYKLVAVPICPDSISILLKGRILDVVKSLHDGRPTLSAQTAEFENNVRMLDWLLDICRIFPDDFVYPNGVIFFPNVMSQTLVAGVNQLGETLPKHHYDPNFVDYFAILALATNSVVEKRRKLIPKLIMERANFFHAAAPAPEIGEDWSTPLGIKNETLREAHHSCEMYDTKVKLQRKIFTTEKGYVGLGPLRMQDGDTICLIYGADVPFLLRKRAEGGYLLVGECYLNGLMQGEGMAMGVEEDIVLY